MAQENLQVEIAAATMNLYPYDLPGRGSWGSNLEQLVPFLEQTGFHDYEVLPTQTIVDDVVRRQASGDLELANRLIGSQHQSFFEGKGIVGWVGDHRGAYRNEASIGAMAIVQAALDEPVPTVYYFPNQLPEQALTDESTAGALRILQPAAEAYPQFGVTNLQGFVRAAGALGLVGLCADTFHFRRVAQNGDPAPAATDRWSDMFASGRVYEAHIAGDRRDLVKRDPEVAAKTVKEFEAFASNSWRRARATELGEMVVAAVESWKLPPELEAKRTVRMVGEFPPVPQEYLRRQKQQARFVENLANILHEAGAEPRLWADAA